MKSSNVLVKRRGDVRRQENYPSCMVCLIEDNQTISHRHGSPTSTCCNFHLLLASWPDTLSTTVLLLLGHLWQYGACALTPGLLKSQCTPNLCFFHQSLFAVGYLRILLFLMLYLLSNRIPTLSAKVFYRSVNSIPYLACFLILPFWQLPSTRICQVSEKYLTHLETMDVLSQDSPVLQISEALGVLTFS